jgi:hypothetical protein
MGKTDCTIKAPKISSNGLYHDTFERFCIVCETKGSNQISDQHKIRHNNISYVITYPIWYLFHPVLSCPHVRRHVRQQGICNTCLHLLHTNKYALMNKTLKRLHTLFITIYPITIISLFTVTQFIKHRWQIKRYARNDDIMNIPSIENIYQEM